MIQFVTVPPKGKWGGRAYKLETVYVHIPVSTSASFQFGGGGGGPFFLTPQRESGPNAEMNGGKQKVLTQGTTVMKN